MTAVKYQTMPPLSPEQYAQLEQSILADGVQVPIIVDDSGVIIDGHHRKAIADHHGLHCPREVRSMLTEDQKIELSVQLNIARRQLSKEEIVAQIARLRESGKSIRRISELTSVPKSTVSDAVRELSETGQLEQPETVRGNDGKDRPAVFKRTETTKEEFTEEVDGMTVDTRTGEIVDTPPTGLDGKEYKRPEPQAPRAEPITSQFTSAIAELNRVMARLRRISDDKNFARNKEQIASMHASDLSRTIDELETLVNQIS